MLTAATLLSGILAAFSAILWFEGWPTPAASASLGWIILLITWALLGVSYSATQTPSGRLLRRSAHAQDRPAVFAAQFALSHACWLVTYPLAGWLGAALPLASVAGLFSMGTLASVVVASRVWPLATTDVVSHAHPELSKTHPHLLADTLSHSHAFIIDDLHQRWPTNNHREMHSPA